MLRSLAEMYPLVFLWEYPLDMFLQYQYDLILEPRMCQMYELSLIQLSSWSIFTKTQPPATTVDCQLSKCLKLGDLAPRLGNFNGENMIII